MADKLSIIPVAGLYFVSYYDDLMMTALYFNGNFIVVNIARVIIKIPLINYYEDIDEVKFH